GTRHWECSGCVRLFRASHRRSARGGSGRATPAAGATNDLPRHMAIRKIRNARHSIEGEVQVFRYTPIVAWAFIIGPPLLGVVANFVAFGPTLSPSVESISAVAVGVLAACLLSLVGIWYRSFSITVSGSAISVRSIFRNTTAQFSELQKILVTGSRGRTLV